MITSLLRSVLILAAAGWLIAADPVVKAGDHVAVIGDSITEQKIYSRMIEVYLLTSSGIADLDVAAFGWSGETAGGWVDRGQRSSAWFKPTVATTCYGMNDGRYGSYTDAIGKTFRDSTAKYADQMKQAGVRELVIGSPGAVDTTTWRSPVSPATYNQTLEKLTALARSVADEKGVRFADLHHPVVAAMAKAKAMYGNAYHVSGGDGIHPDQNGHLLMAGAFLAALGCDGEIARITFREDGTVAASAGHTVVKAEAGAVELDSIRWPFVLGGDGTSPGSTRSIAPCTDFVERLDRFVVAMPGCTWAKARISWGNREATVDGADLKAGVNLMAVFTATPFDQSSEALHKVVEAKQEIEKLLVKNILCFYLRPAIEADPEAKAALQKVIDRVVVVRNEKAAAARALIKPVRYRIALAQAP